VIELVTKKSRKREFLSFLIFELYREGIVNEMKISQRSFKKMFGEVMFDF